VRAVTGRRKHLPCSGRDRKDLRTRKSSPRGAVNLLKDRGENEYAGTNPRAQSGSQLAIDPRTKSRVAPLGQNCELSVGIAETSSPPSCEGTQYGTGLPLKNFASQLWVVRLEQFRCANLAGVQALLLNHF
jgi:hypothetical protein